MEFLILCFVAFATSILLLEALDVCVGGNADADAFNGVKYIYVL